LRAYSSLIDVDLFAVGETIVRKKGGEYFAKKKANAPNSSTQVPFSRMRVGMPEDDLGVA
jgi:hypothetical protein